MLTIEFEPPRRTTCDCCGAETTRLTRFVSDDDAAYAVYYASFGASHPDEVKAVVSIGMWGGDDASPADRNAFPLVLWQNDTEYGVTVVDAAQSPWRDVEFLGRMLDRDEALAHPLIKDVFHVTDHIFAEDAEIREVFARAAPHPGPLPA